MNRLVLATALLASVLCSALVIVAEEPARPNILWITSEDNGPHLGCYGDDYATTPNLDALAVRGMIYRTCWSNAPVCAPARTTIISGMYPTSLGAEHMRSMTRLPDAFKMYPQYLREAGYYCTNNSKEDYNLEKPGKVWDDSSGKAHWKNRADGQPFFAIFNHTISHESKLRTRPHKAVHDPAKVRVPAYHPDTPEVRQDWAQYYDRLTEMDVLAGANLQEIAEAGLADDTIVFYYGDHGSGMPRSKRWPYNSGLHVPLIVYIPEKFQHLRPDDYVAGGSTDRLVSFVDLAPTLLSLCGIEPPAHMQGHAFAGKFTAPRQDFVYGYRGRMDERYDMVRSVTDGRYVYIRNYMPHKIYGQYIDYMFQTPTTRIWKELFDAGQLNEAQSHFWKAKPGEELYDLKNDPDEVHNLANSPEHQEIRQRMREAQQYLAVKIRDIGFLPEGEIHLRSAGSTPYEMAHDDAQYPLAKIMAVAEKASLLRIDAIGNLISATLDEDSAVRYWGAMGLLMRGETGVSVSRGLLWKALNDESPGVRIAAAEALGRYGNKVDVAAALPVLLDLASPTENGVYTSMAALNAIDSLGAKAASAIKQIAELPTQDPKADGRMKGYVPNLIKKTLADLK
ncbi:MAG: sulfatase-like hydrolase/transferase [Planctomycetota bacterium]|nr:sulfatase-like hydrolase/transferase [Planctomycetota bacterium]